MELTAALGLAKDVETPGINAVSCLEVLAVAGPGYDEVAVLIHGHSRLVLRVGSELVYEEIVAPGCAVRIEYSGIDAGIVVLSHSPTR